MSDNMKSVLVDIGKFALTGLLTFFCSYLYTNFKTQPAANVDIVPIAIKDDTACEVNQAGLNETLRKYSPQPTGDLDMYTVELSKSNEEGWTGRFKWAGAPPNAPDEYASFLFSIRTRFIYPRTVSPQIKQRLIQDKIILCVDNDGAPAADRSGDTILSVQAVMVIDEPVSYALQRDCALRLNDKSPIPLRLEMDGVPDYVTAITVEKTASLMLKYEPSMSPHDQEARRELSSSIDALVRSLGSPLEYRLSVTCSVISARDGSVAVGGRAVRFRDRSTVKATT